MLKKIIKPAFWALVLFAISALVSSLFGIYKIMQMENWPKADGKVVKIIERNTQELYKNAVRSTNLHNQKYINFYIDYEYKVKDDEYQGNMISLDNRYKKVEAENSMQVYYFRTKYSKNNEIEVLYNPNNPEESYLEIPIILDYSLDKVGLSLALLLALFILRPKEDINDDQIEG